MSGIFPRGQFRGLQHAPASRLAPEHPVVRYAASNRRAASRLWCVRPRRAELPRREPPAQPKPFYRDAPRRRSTFVTGVARPRHLPLCSHSAIQLTCRDTARTADTDGPGSRRLPHVPAERATEDTDVYLRQQRTTMHSLIRPFHSPPPPPPDERPGHHRSDSLMHISPRRLN